MGTATTRGVALRTFAVCAWLAVLVVGSVGCGDDRDATAGDGSSAQTAGDGKASTNVTVDIVNGRYRPAVVRVPVGGTVTWINRDPEEANTAEHYSKRTKFDTKTLFPYEKATVRLDKPGRFRYHSSLDAKLNGLVVVEPQTR